MLRLLDPQAHAQRNARASMLAMRLRRGQSEEAERAVEAAAADPVNEARRESARRSAR